MYKAGILTASDKGSKGERQDESGKVIEEILLKSGFDVTVKVIVPDEKEQIKEALYNMINNKVNLIITTGGTGFSKRDVTPEATEEIIERKTPGISEAIRYNSLNITKRAMLSRATSGIKDDSLIINMPGSPKAVRESLEFVIDTLYHGLDILLGKSSECARK
ncbi:molybdenum cofactor synthesis domain-containing protein [Acetoanaerobium pronyense]|uniref:Molybdenum cofactor synthesis domain-containing protein n=1 Tax=Acetoanaerobium pronyense TaxID=1482736 RepID=A0ABS4KI60_9FIRM|nr:MogA/MoaB family molybdenum cofactor biosynthesis protein [Acetoanaerobium pronyense]MBP2026821.1 molybdenum cofactor synthesis domain-containing protein [Acetoanaerobium pronyense]